MNDIIFKACLWDIDFLKCYKKNNNNRLKGYGLFLKEIIEEFTYNYNIYLDKPYLDISYLKVNDKIIDIDLLFDIFKLAIEERGAL
jgi:hypothetical protein